MPYEEETLIQREIYLDGKNVCRVNGQLLSVSVLRKLGLQLINIHGQRDSQQLFDEGYHLTYLDAFAGNEALLASYEEKFHAVAAPPQGHSAADHGRGGEAPADGVPEVSD